MQHQQHAGPPPQQRPEAAAAEELPKVPSKSQKKRTLQQAAQRSKQQQQQQQQLRQQAPRGKDEHEAARARKAAAYEESRAIAAAALRKPGAKQKASVDSSRVSEAAPSPEPPKAAPRSKKRTTRTPRSRQRVASDSGTDSGNSYSPGASDSSDSESGPPAARAKRPRRKQPEPGSDSKSYKAPTKFSGRLFTSVPLTLFDKGASPKELVEVATLSGREASLWTRRQDDNGNGIWRLFPQLEGGFCKPDYLTSEAPPHRCGDGSLPKVAASVKDITLNIKMHKVEGTQQYIPMLLNWRLRQSRDAKTGPTPDTKAILEQHSLLMDEMRNRLQIEESVQESDERLISEENAANAKATEPPLQGSVEYQEEEAAEEADSERHTSQQQKQDEGGLRHSPQQTNFKHAVHEGARLLLLEAILGKGQQYDGDPERALNYMCSRDADGARTERLLESFGASAQALGVTPAHLMGEALELLTAHAYIQRRDITIRNYLAEDQSGRQFVSCTVRRCFISAAPTTSPFRMRQQDMIDLSSALAQQAEQDGVDVEEANSLAERLYEYMCRDHAFDVLVWLETDDRKHNHFLVVQCKARTNREVRVKGLLHNLPS
ncbi:hypothetical protein OEZ85_002344 [Tetradesmus obliquus]|uniref:Uncharacterized protein n=1 Tax=Tetradesmus obliquus TaxID=3088 RepID=A0ABY8U3M0_TETOB|nr:hypothetical protein OEZ85_002344 [Tetradesmus obliquus]